MINDFTREPFRILRMTPDPNGRRFPADSRKRGMIMAKKSRPTLVTILIIVQWMLCTSGFAAGSTMLVDDEVIGEGQQTDARPSEPEPVAWEPITKTEGVDYPLFVGIGSASTPAYQIDVVSGAAIQAYLGTHTWGSAYDALKDRVIFCSYADLYQWPVGGYVSSLGTITDAAGSPLDMHGLAFRAGTLYGTSLTTDTIFTINLETLIATPLITLVDPGVSISGLAVDPTTGDFYATDDGTNAALVRINLGGTLTTVAPYVAGETDVDGLAISPDRLAYLITDDDTPPTYDVFDLDLGAYVGTVANPWTGALGNQVGGAWITEPAQGPLFTGLNSSTEPAYRVDLGTGTAHPVFIADHVWGAAYDPLYDRVIFNNAADLYQWPVSGSPTLLGTIAGGVAMHGLAFHDGTLYGISITTDTLYTIDLVTFDASPFITLVVPASISGLAVDPTSGEFYGTDDTSLALVRINLDGSLTTVAPYQAGETDVDGLAISPGRLAYLMTDDDTPPTFAVFDLSTLTWVGTVVNPYIGAPGAQVGGAWIIEGFAEIFADGFESGGTGSWSDTSS